MLGAYIHIPFCRTKCPYCDFLSVPIPGTVPEEYIDGLCREIDSFHRRAELGSVFFGGGTPSLLSPKSLRRVMETLRDSFGFQDPEITLEANPDDVTEALAHAWAEAGINRVSLGVQSFNDAALRYLGRRHDAAAALRACQIVSNQYENWGMDLIFGAKPVETWEETLKTCKSLKPKHVSAYGLTYEAGTPFGARSDETVCDSKWLELFRQTERDLEDFEHYEISNYARSGSRCRHNLIYWHNEEYVGFGLGAYSFLGGIRSRNTTDLERYLHKPGIRDEELHLSDREIRVETVIQHLRLKDGLRKADYLNRFGSEIRADFGASIDNLIGRGLVVENEEALHPTAQGFELNNEIGLALVD